MENVDRAEKRRIPLPKHAKFSNPQATESPQMVLDASLCGVPQNENRFFKSAHWNEKTILQKTFAGKNIGTRDNVKENALVILLILNITIVIREITADVQFFRLTNPHSTMRGVNRPVPKGYPGHPGDACPLNDDIRALTTL